MKAAPTSVRARAPRSTPTSVSRFGWLIPTAIIALGLIPIIANVLRRAALSMGAGDTAAEPAAPLTLATVLHITAATVFVLLGAFQLSARLRRRRPAWHRVAGRVLLGVGLVAALSGLWLSVSASAAGSSALLLAFRLLAGTGMAAAIVLGFAAIRRRDFARHRAWMIRAVAIGLGAGTQVFTLGIGEAFVGATELSVALLNGAGWAINLAVAELVIRHPWRHGRLAAARVPALP